MASYLPQDAGDKVAMPKHHRLQKSNYRTVLSKSQIDKLWTECLEDCSGDETKARQLHTKIVTSVSNQLKRKRARPASPSLSDSYHPEDSESSNVQSNTVEAKLQWEKPGALSKRLGIKQSILRTLTKAAAVQTMVSPGGHRLFNVASVEGYIASAATAPRSQPTSISINEKLPHEQRQLLVYLRLRDTDQEQAQLDAISDRIRSQVLKRYHNICTADELQSCVFIFELNSDEKENQPGQGTPSFTNTPGTRRLLQAICNRNQAQSLVVLRSERDISNTPSTYAFFQLLCRNVNAVIEIAPELGDEIVLRS